MSLSKIESLISKRRLKKLEKKMLSIEVTVPKEVSEWQRNLSKQELEAWISFGFIPDDLRPVDMVNPGDILCQELPMSALNWAKKHIKRAKTIDDSEPDKSKLDSWVQLVLLIYGFWKRKQDGVADSLPPDAKPMKKSDFVEGKMIKEHPDDEWGYFRPARNYRKKPKIMS